MKTIKAFYILILIYIGSLVWAVPTYVSRVKNIKESFGASVLQGYQGGTGIGTATAGDVGNCLKVSDDSPFTFTLGACGSGSGAAADWQTIFNETAIRPSTTRGIFVSASSSIIGDFRVTGHTTTTESLYLGSMGTINFLDQADGDLYVANSLEVDSSSYFSGDVTLVGSNTDIIHNGVLFIKPASGLIVTASTSISANFGVSGNATTSGYQVVGLVNPINNMSAGDLLVGGSATTTATSTAQGFKGLNLIAAACDVKASAEGALYCGTDASGSGGSGSAAWHQYLGDVTAITPTTSGVGIFVTASSTILATTTIAQNAGNTYINSKVLQVGDIGNKHYFDASGDGSNLIYLAKDNFASDASVIFGGAGWPLWEFGAAGGDGYDLYLKKISTSTGSLVFSNLWFFDYQTGRFGLGTEAPSSLFEIASTSPTARVDLRVNNKGTGGTDGASVQLVAEGDGHVAYFGTDAGLNGGQNIFINYGTFGTGLFIDSAGNVGSNDTSLTWDFESPTALFASASTSDHFDVGTYLTVSGTPSSTITSGLVIDTSTLVVNTNENRVGIGTASPSTTLGVLGATRLNGAATISGQTTLTGYLSCNLDTDANGLVTCGTDAIGSYPFTFGTTYEQATNVTTTPLWLRGTPFSLFASSTAIFDQASTTQLTVFSHYNVSGSVTSTIAGGLTIDTSTFVLNANENRLGIGTTTPKALLDMFSTGTTTQIIDSSSVTAGACIKLKDMDGTGYTYIYGNNGELISDTVSCQ